MLSNISVTFLFSIKPWQKSNYVSEPRYIAFPFEPAISMYPSMTLAASR